MPPILLTDNLRFAIQHLGLQSEYVQIPTPEAFDSLAQRLNTNNGRRVAFYQSQDAVDCVALTDWDLVASFRSVIGSQFDDLIEWRREDVTSASWRVACFAESGAGFHGQRDRVWQALLGNIHFSCLIPMAVDLTAVHPALSAAPAVAAIRAMKGSFLKKPPSIKWVNDIEIGGGKIAGSLTQTICQPDGSFDLFFGVGINVKRTPLVEPTPFCPAVTCLNDAVGAHVSLSGIAQNLARESALAAKRLAAAPFSLVSEYKSHANLVGRSACIWPTGTSDWRAVAPLARGRIIGIDDRLRLLLDTESEPISTGRLALDCGAFLREQ